MKILPYIFDKHNPKVPQPTTCKKMHMCQFLINTQKQFYTLQLVFFMNEDVTNPPCEWKAIACDTWQHAIRYALQHTSGMVLRCVAWFLEMVRSGECGSKAPFLRAMLHLKVYTTNVLHSTYRGFQILGIRVLYLQTLDILCSLLLLTSEKFTLFESIRFQLNIYMYYILNLFYICVFTL